MFGGRSVTVSPVRRTKISSDPSDLETNFDILTNPFDYALVDRDKALHTSFLETYVVHRIPRFRSVIGMPLQCLAMSDLNGADVHGSSDP